MLCKCPFYQIRNFILYFVSLLLTSPSFCYLLDYSAHFRLLLFTSSFGLSYLRMFLTILVYVKFYLSTISDSRMFIVPILTWSIRNTVSVLWNLLVHRVATIHKKCLAKHESQSSNLVGILSTKLFQYYRLGIFFFSGAEFFCSKVGQKKVWAYRDQPQTNFHS